jgi:hypothetical protein
MLVATIAWEAHDVIFIIITAKNIQNSESKKNVGGNFDHSDMDYTFPSLLILVKFGHSIVMLS